MIFSISNSSRMATLSAYADYREYENHERHAQNSLRGQVRWGIKTRVFSTQDLHLTPA